MGVFIYTLALIFFIIPVSLRAYLSLKNGRFPLPYFQNNVVVNRIKLRKAIGIVSPLLFWGLHVLYVGRIAERVGGPFLVAWGQFLVVGVVCTAWAIGYETITLDGLREALIPILYTGIISVGFAYTGQVVAQRYAGAADAAIILSSETLFAALFGYLLMGDRLNALGVAGCVLIFVCIIAVQLAPLIGARIQADGARS